MSEARIFFDAKTLRQGGVGPATGNVWVMLGDVAFPQIGWNDFAVVVLEAWVSAILRLLRSVSRNELVHFMDGPYVVELAQLSEDTLRLRANSHGRGEEICVDTKALPLIESLLIASEGALMASRYEACWSVDADRLSTSLPVLRREVVKLKN